MTEEKLEPIMTVDRTRKMLGSEVSSLTDDQVQEMINSARNFCAVVVDNFHKVKTKDCCNQIK
jgi:hypothetical protein